jgi:hypothetical protein
VRPAPRSVPGSAVTSGETESDRCTGRRARSPRANRAASSASPLSWGTDRRNNWHYRLTPAGDGTDVTESFRLTRSVFASVYYWVFGGWLRQRNNIRDMTKTLNRIKQVVEAS